VEEINGGILCTVSREKIVENGVSVINVEKVCAKCGGRNVYWGKLIRTELSMGRFFACFDCWNTWKELSGQARCPDAGSGENKYGSYEN